MEDLTGRIFERLTVIRFDHKKNKRMIWKCLCSCGNFVSYRSDALKSGRRKSCGCIKSPNEKEYFEKLKNRLIKNLIRNGECLEWTGQISPYGYGYITIRSIPVAAHRVSWMVFKGEIPEGMCILHSCDNKKCCEISHLHLGTQLENVKEAVDRNRYIVGIKHHSSKLTEDQIKEIRCFYKDGLYNLTQLSKKYGIGICSISDIVKRKTWKHI